MTERSDQFERTSLGPTRCTRIVLGTCHHDCPDTCGWVVTVERTEDRAVKLRGNPDHPYSPGRALPEGQSLSRPGLSPRPGASSADQNGAQGQRRVPPGDLGRGPVPGGRSGPARSIAEHGGEAIFPGGMPAPRGLIQMTSLDRRFFARLGAVPLRPVRFAEQPPEQDWPPPMAAGMSADPTGRSLPKLHHPVGDQHPPHQPTPVALHRRGAGQRCQGRGDRPDQDDDRRLGRLVHSAAARNRRCADAGGHARADPRRSHRSRLRVERYAIGFRRAESARRRSDPGAGGRRSVASRSRRSRRWPAPTEPPDADASSEP